MSITEFERLAKLRALKARVDTELAELEHLVAMLPKKPRRAIALCGTDGGYYRHVRTVGEAACEPCKKAHAQAERERSRRARKVA